MEKFRASTILSACLCTFFVAVGLMLPPSPLEAKTAPPPKNVTIQLSGDLSISSLGFSPSTLLIYLYSHTSNANEYQYVVNSLLYFSPPPAKTKFSIQAISGAEQGDATHLVFAKRKPPFDNVPPVTISTNGLPAGIYGWTTFRVASSSGGDYPSKTVDLTLTNVPTQ